MGNRNPIVAIGEDKTLDILIRKPQQGSKVTLDASNSSDPDGDQLTFHWWVLSAAGTANQEVQISNSRSPIATVDVPSGSAGKTFHVICEVTDDGTHNLSGYRRIVFEPTK
ncbi:hypothetical protein [Stieleria tagensis]|uniref:hypothetical protein n=1 Tax=Stieleria tagensis TaxID=2956795 RepID=UPI0036F3ABEE